MKTEEWGRTAVLDLHGPRRLWVADGRTCVLLNLKIVALTNPARPELIGAWDSGPGRVVCDVAVRGSTPYAVGNGFWALDIGDPGAPRLLKSLDEEAMAVPEANDRAYVGGEDGLRLYDVRDPARTAWIASYRNNAGEAGPVNRAAWVTVMSRDGSPLTLWRASGLETTGWIEAEDVMITPSAYARSKHPAASTSVARSSASGSSPRESEIRRE